MRRRAHRLALWSKRVIDPLGGTQSIRWLGGQAFRLEVDGPRAPFQSLMVTGLVESDELLLVGPAAMAPATRRRSALFPRGDHDHGHERRDGRSARSRASALNGSSERA